LNWRKPPFQWEQPVLSLCMRTWM